MEKDGEEDFDFPIRIARIILSSLSLLLHFLGVYSIFAYKKKSNQNIILCSLTVAEIILSLQTMIYCGMAVSDTHFDIMGNLNQIMNNCVFYVSYYGLIFAMFILTFDRLICVIDPLKYQSRMTRKRVGFLVAITWLISLSLGILVGYWRNTEATRTIASIADVSCFVFLLVSYTFIIIRLKKSRDLFKNINSESELSNRKSIRKEHLVPGVIVVTFLLFYCLPFVVEKAIGDHQALYLCGNVGLLTDPLTYIFLAKHYRNNVVRIFCHSGTDRV